MFTYLKFLYFSKNKNECIITIFIDDSFVGVSHYFLLNMSETKRIYDYQDLNIENKK